MDDSAGRLRTILLVVLLTIAVGGGADLVLDRPSTLWSAHVLLEVALVAGALATVVWLWSEWRSAERSVGELRRSLEAQTEERDRWRDSARSALEGLGFAIDEQFRRWDLTESEREVALLLLKGHSHKKIARHTGRSAQTVRQHATAVYRKGSLAGRAELAAFFLEAVMLPEDAQVGRRDWGESEGAGPERDVQ